MWFTSVVMPVAVGAIKLASSVVSSAGEARRVAGYAREGSQTTFTDFDTCFTKEEWEEFKKTADPERARDLFVEAVRRRQAHTRAGASERSAE